MKTTGKNGYYNQRFQLYKNNLKETWKLIGTFIKRKTKGLLNCPSRIMRNNNKVYTNELHIANQFNHHFTNIRPECVLLQAQLETKSMIIPLNT